MVERQQVSESRVRFPSDGLHLEGVFHRPAGPGPFPAIVVCHPHPLYGGEMDNNVVLAISHAVCEASIAALRFNFRGVERSEGEFADGIGEQEDVRAALEFVSTQAGVDPGRIGLAGYSFGAKVALPVALVHEKVRALVLVSPFVEDEEWDQLSKAAFPKLLISGSDDGYISPHKLQRLSGTEPTGDFQCEIVQGADHFWSGYESLIARKASAFFAKHL
jgi:uncharacterized protein